MTSKGLSNLRNNIINIYYKKAKAYIYFLIYFNYFSRNKGRSYILQSGKLCPKELLISLEEDGVERIHKEERGRRTYLLMRDSNLKITICYKGGEMDISRVLLFRRPFNTIFVLTSLLLLIIASSYPLVILVKKFL